MEEGDELLEELLRREYAKLLAQKVWDFVRKPLPRIERNKYSRKKVKSIPGIGEVKDILSTRFGIIAIYIVVSFLCEICGYLPSPFRCFEGYLLILWQLVGGFQIQQMQSYMAKSTFFIISNHVWRSERTTKISAKLGDLLKKMFSTERIRVLSAKLHNPPQFRSATMFGDGHDNRINFSSMHNVIGFKNKKKFYSWKLKKPGYRTQILIDVNNYVIFVSPSKPALINTDQKMMVKYRFDKLMTKNDCIYLDGLYKGAHKELIEKNNNEGGELNDDNFRFPIRKLNNIAFSKGETKYNDQFGGIRSTIESKFAEIGNQFNRFHCDNRPNIKENTYNCQLKLCCFLLNLSIICESFEIQEFHREWLREGFDFLEKDEIILEDDRTVNENDKEKRINVVQNRLIDRIMMENNLGINSYSDSDQEEDDHEEDDQEEDKIQVQINETDYRNSEDEIDPQSSDDGEEIVTTFPITPFQFLRDRDNLIPPAKKVIPNENRILIAKKKLGKKRKRSKIKKNKPSHLFPSAEEHTSTTPRRSMRVRKFKKF